MVYVIAIENWRPTPLNKLMGHWSKGHKLKKADRQIIAHYCRNIPKATGKRAVDIHVILGKGKRKTDPDSLHKSTLDALVHCGMLVNDNDTYVELGRVTQGKVADTPMKWHGTILVLTDL